MNHALPADLAWALPGGMAGARFSTCADGNLYNAPERAAFAGAACPGRVLVVPGKQVHGTRIVRVQRADQEPGECDGLLSDDPRIALGVYGADCPGLVLSAGRWLLVAHCGWRAVAAGMVAQAVHTLYQASGIPPLSYGALIGPGISGAQYEVDAPVLNAYAWPVAALRDSRPGHALLDLGLVIGHDLHAQGVSSVLRPGVCTAADARLRSYRHNPPPPGRVGISHLLIAQRLSP